MTINGNFGLAYPEGEESQPNLITDDDKLKDSIRSAINWYSPALFKEITIIVEKGKVTLYGNVSWIYQKMVIASIVHNIEGVKEIVNNITVNNYKE